MKASDALKLLRWPLIWMLVAVIGGALNLLGWYAFESRPMAIAGFILCAAGIVFGIVAMVIGQATVVRASMSGHDKNSEEET